MKQILLRGGLPLLMTVTLTGCFDDNYDLSDIDTTSEFKVKDLVLPFNLDPVTLGDIIEIKEGEQIKEITLNGETFYAVQESGDFKSDPINIPSFTAPAPNLQPASLGFELSTPQGAAKAAENGISLPLKNPILRDFKFTSTNVDPSILELNDIYADNFNIAIHFKASSSIMQLADLELSNIKLDIPKGITIEEIVPMGSNYNNGSLSIPSLPLDGNGEATIMVTASAINLPAIGATLNNTNHTLDITTEVNINDAVLLVSPKSNNESNVPGNVSIDINYTISPLVINAVSGKIRYQLEGDALKISPISLSSIPDFLSGDGTNLILANPQIYLSVNNPVAENKLGFQTGLQLTAIRDNEENKVFSLDNGYFRVGYDKGINGPYNFCLSPNMPTNVPSDFSNPSWEPFSNLGYVISGNGIPNKIDIKLIDPQVYEQSVERFELGKSLDALTGKWDFIAPLAMAEGTDAKIIYTDVVDGWGSDDLDKLLIQKLEVNLNVTNDTPLQAVLTGYPIDKNGNQINGVSIEGASIPGGANNTPITLRITGEVKNLDGIKFTATVTPQNGNAISPTQSITLSNIKAKVSGNYTTDF